MIFLSGLKASYGLSGGVNIVGNVNLQSEDGSKVYTYTQANRLSATTVPQLDLERGV